MMRFMGMALVLLVMATTSYGSSSYAVGAVNSDGYVYQGGGVWLWQQDGTLWTYQQRYDPYSYSYRNTYVFQGYYRAPAAYVAPKQDLDYDKLQSKLLDIMSDRNKAIIRERERSIKHAAFLEILDATGMKGNFNLKEFGTAVGYPAYSMPGASSYQYGPHGYQGQTAYGYSVSTIANLYGDGDHHLGMQQAVRLGQNSQDISREHVSTFMKILEKDNDARARVATIIAERDYKIEMLKAAGNLRVAPQSKIEKKEYIHKSVVEPNGRIKVEKIEVAPPEPKGPIAPEPKVGTVERLPDETFMATIVMPDCASCHTGKNAKGKFVASEYLSLTERLKEIVRARVHSGDPKERMPQGPNDTPGEPQSDFKKLQWKLH